MTDALHSWDAPLTEKLVQQVYELANTRLDVSLYQQRCRDFGWNVKPILQNDFVCYVEIDNQILLNFGAEDGQVTCAILPFHHWEEYEEEWHDSPETYHQEKEAFNAA